MMTLKQAHDAIDSLLESPRTQLCRGDHRILAQALELLYDGAKENEETNQVVKDPD
jgi:hypothetical protein